MHMMGYQRGWGEQVYEAIRPCLSQAHQLYMGDRRPIPRNNERAGPGHILSGA